MNQQLCKDCEEEIPQVEMIFLMKSECDIEPCVESQRGDSVIAKPSLNEFLKYAEGVAKFFVAKKYSSVPFEMKEECVQEAMIRALDIYKNKLIPGRSWKSYCGKHAKGAVQDYFKKGSSFEECKWSLKGDLSVVSKRVSLVNVDGSEQLDVSSVLGRNGVFTEHDFEQPQINWKLLSKLASQDMNVKILGKYLLGFRKEEIKKEFGLTGERIGQILSEMFERIRAPKEIDLQYSQFRQLIFALGFRSYLGQEFKDEHVGWSFPSVDLFKNDSHCERDEKQLSMAL